MTRKKSTDSPRLVRCTAPGIRVEVGEHGHLFTVGEVVDLDTEAAPGITWREALGDHLDHFEPTERAESESSVTRVEE